MGLYSRFILPRLLEKSMSSPTLASIRRNLLTHATGRVLEIGIGSGLNLPAYPSRLKSLTAVDMNPGFAFLVKERITSSGIKVEHIVADIERLPFADDAFDTVVSTWTLCSVKNTSNALREIRRVLKPHGKLLFVEHGLSSDKTTQRLQRLMTPFWKMYKGGCRLDRNIAALLTAEGFILTTCKEFDLPTTKRLTRYTYQGIAIKR